MVDPPVTSHWYTNLPTDSTNTMTSVNVSPSSYQTIAAPVSTEPFSNAEASSHHINIYGINHTEQTPAIAELSVYAFSEKQEGDDGACGSPTDSGSLPPFNALIDVQWSSFRVCDPLLPYRQPTPPIPTSTAHGLHLQPFKPELPPMKNLALLSPAMPGYDPGVHPDLLLENGYELGSSRILTFNNEDVNPGGEMHAELWQM